MLKCRLQPCRVSVARGLSLSAVPHHVRGSPTSGEALFDCPFPHLASHHHLRRRREGQILLERLSLLLRRLPQVAGGARHAAEVLPSPGPAQPAPRQAEANSPAQLGVAVLHLAVAAAVIVRPSRRSLPDPLRAEAEALRHLALIPRLLSRRRTRAQTLLTLHEASGICWNTWRQFQRSAQPLL